MRQDTRSPIWGGATLGLVVGLILGFFVGTYWMTVLYAVGIGAAVGVVANILGWLSDRGRNRAATQPKMSAPEYSSFLANLEPVLYEHSPADFETTPDAAAECVYYVTTPSTRSTPRMKRGIPIFVSTLLLLARSGSLKSLIM